MKRNGEVRILLFQKLVPERIHFVKGVGVLGCIYFGKPGFYVMLAVGVMVLMCLCENVRIIREMLAKKTYLSKCFFPTL